MLKKTAIILCLSMVMAVAAGIAHAATTINGSKPNNPYGFMLMVDGGDASDGILHHLRLARNWTGEWGYARTGCGVNTDAGNINDYAKIYSMLRAMHLIPVLTALRLPESYYEPDNQDMPKLDPDGSMTSFAKCFEDWARALYAKGMTIPYFEFGNELNGGFYGDHPEVYAQMCIAVSKALHRVDPNISFGTAGMAGCGDDFYDAMLTKVPELTKYVDHWGLHPYAANHPPGFTDELGNYGVGSHRWTAKALEKHGVKDPVFIMTETGYELGNEKDKNFPKITEDNRAEYMSEAFKRYYVPDPRVRGVMMFILQDAKWSGWDGWEYIRSDFSHTPMYDLIAAQPKPKGSDYMPQGKCSIKGKIRDKDLSRGIGDVIVWMWRPDKGGYAAVTDDDGSFVIEGVPDGTYNIKAFRDAFETTAETTVTLKSTKQMVWNAGMKRDGYLVLKDSSQGAKLAPGWTPTNGDDGLAVDLDVKRSGKSSQRIDANGQDKGLWNITGYLACLPDKEYSAEVWVKTKGLQASGKKGVELLVEMTDAFARQITTARVQLNAEGDNEWTPLQVVCKTPPKARRIRVFLSCEAEAGSAWFDDLFVHESAWPLPSCYEMAKKSVGDGKSISGAVFGMNGQERLQNATVWVVPTGKFATTDYLGQFKIDGLPDGEYTVVAAHDKYDSSTLPGVEVGAVKQRVVMKQKPAPRELVDPGFEDIPRISTWFTGWQRWGSLDGIVGNGWHKGMFPDLFPNGFQSHSGNGFYGAVAGSNIKDGGVYQTIEVEPDALYEVSVWSMTCQTNDGNRGDVANQMGVDPMGGGEPSSAHVVWSPLRPSQAEWTQIKLCCRPVGNRLTVFLHHLQIQGLVFNCNFFDDVKVEKIGEPKKTWNMDE